jgi:diphthine-ammonia ligase
MFLYYYRACVGSNLPFPIKIQIDLMAIKHISKDDSSKPRKTMRVQSMSYWAPANIGPYSQATIVSFILSCDLLQNIQ